MYQLLIVDDQPDLVEDLATMLPWSNIGIETVHTAFSAAEALELIAMTPVDIVISDIRMPGRSGLDLLEAIERSWSHIKCILLSGYNDFEYAQRALKSKASNYLLKPVEDEELLNAVSKAIDELESRWREISSHQGALDTLRVNLPIMRNYRLQQLLKGQMRKDEDWQKQLDMLGMPIAAEARPAMMLLRMEDYFLNHNEEDRELFQYAICNMAEEIFSDNCDLWYTRDEYGYYVFLIFPRFPPGQNFPESALEQKITQLQHYVKLYLKGTVSLVLSKPFPFPSGVAAAYEQLLASFRQRIGAERDFLFLQKDEHEQHEANSLSLLYQPPLLTHLLEAGQWEAASEKLKEVFGELEQKFGDSHEHILESYYSIASALSYSAHKNKLWLSELLGNGFNQLLAGPHFHTIKQLQSWTNEAIIAYRDYMNGRVQDSRSGIIQKVHEYASAHLKDASLQSIAAYVYLNPSYLSKLYKLETGEGISDYLSRLKMETAAHLLRSSTNKIYEIAEHVGYQKTSYFIKVFKDRYGITPQEFREH
ncbi:response regulator [Paenibacillus sp. HB172176]|uniref:response regulator n=1 Tax=Paenibacillus sp. HB172176 TaxID=2493690 RepID=UPI0014394DB1|nr:response regulator [Paenibacillus sp. HB172176]